MRPHVVSFIDRIFELDWTEERLHRLLDQFAFFTFTLPPDLTLAEFLADVQGLIRAELTVHPVRAPRARPRQTRTRLHVLLEGRAVWDDASWFQTQRYFLDHFTRLGMQLFVILAGCDASGAGRDFKTDAVKLLRNLPPNDSLAAWDRWRAR